MYTCPHISLGTVIPSLSIFSHKMAKIMNSNSPLKWLLCPAVSYLTTSWPQCIGEKHHPPSYQQPLLPIKHQRVL